MPVKRSRGAWRVARAAGCRFPASSSDYLTPGLSERDEGQAMKYLCLIYEEEGNLQALSESEWNGVVTECLAAYEDLQRSGHVLASEALQSVRAATTVRVRNGRLAATDGPFAETKEQLGGFYLIEARDLNEAIQVAARIPSARRGCVEVRPVWKLGQDERRVGGL
jgi:hypothetical protein